MVYSVEEGGAAHAPAVDGPGVFIDSAFRGRDVNFIEEGVVVYIDFVGADADDWT